MVERFVRMSSANASGDVSVSDLLESLKEEIRPHDHEQCCAGLGRLVGSGGHRFVRAARQGTDLAVLAASMRNRHLVEWLRGSREGAATSNADA